MIKKISIILFVSFVFFLYPKNSAKAVLLPFGGYNYFSAPCTCSGETIWYVYYFPLLPLLPTGGAMAVGTAATSLWYSNFDPIIETTLSMGDYIPGGEYCWQPAGDTCVLWPTIGYVWMVGSSIPGATPLL
ncbi:MAG: hypothetical protein WCF92_01655 [bacterium]